MTNNDQDINDQDINEIETLLRTNLEPEQRELLEGMYLSLKGLKGPGMTLGKFIQSVKEHNQRSVESIHGKLDWIMEHLKPRTPNGIRFEIKDAERVPGVDEIVRKLAAGATLPPLKE